MKNWFKYLIVAGIGGFIIYLTSIWLFDYKPNNYVVRIGGIIFAWIVYYTPVSSENEEERESVAYKLGIVFAKYVVPMLFFIVTIRYLPLWIFDYKVNNWVVLIVASILTLWGSRRSPEEKSENVEQKEPSEVLEGE